MSGSKWLALLIVVGVLLLAIFWYRGKNPSVSASATKLQIEITGGFAYVAPTGSDNHLEIAYLNDWTHRKDLDGDGVDEVVCDVNQIGTELKVTRGTIVGHEPAGQALPLSREFNLDKAVVKFPALETANIPLTIGRGAAWPPTPNTPANPDAEADWKDMVPALKAYHAGTTINPNWRTMVNGRVVLPGGHIKATVPSSPIFKKAHFEFKADNAVKFKTALTDKTIYNVDVPGPTVEIQISGATSGFTKLVIQPQGNRVELTLRGLHDMASSIPGNGSPLKDFCTFYQLLQPMPAEKDFLTPHYIEAANATVQAGGKPTPGFFCSGDWF